MLEINFNNRKKSTEIDYNVRPAVWVEVIEFKTTDKNWFNKLNNSGLVFKIYSIEKNQEKFLRFQSIFNFSKYLSLYRNSKISLIKDKVEFLESEDDSELEIKEWILEIDLFNLVLNDDEELHVNIIENNYVQKRVDDWKRRVENLYEKIGNWANNINGATFKRGNKVVFYEELMKSYYIKPQAIDTLDIYKEKKLKITFKPKGLWVIGANGRIDVLTIKNSYYLIDRSPKFGVSDWVIVTNKAEGEEHAFNSEILSKIIDE